MSAIPLLATSTPLPPPRPTGDRPSDPPQEKPSIPEKNGDTVRREIDRLARQAGRLTNELKKLRESV